MYVEHISIVCTYIYICVEAIVFDTIIGIDNSQTRAHWCPLCIVMLLIGVDCVVARVESVFFFFLVVNIFGTLVHPVVIKSRFDLSFCTYVVSARQAVSVLLWWFGRHVINSVSHIYDRSKKFRSPKTQSLGGRYYATIEAVQDWKSPLHHFRTKPTPQPSPSLEQYQQDIREKERPNGVPLKLRQIDR